jgi:uncharacterized Tic20 family protein
MCLFALKSATTKLFARTAGDAAGAAIEISGRYEQVGAFHCRCIAVGYFRSGTFPAVKSGFVSGGLEPVSCRAKGDAMTQTPTNVPPVEPPPTQTQGGNDERLWGMLCHLAALAGFIIPFGSIIGPLVVWLIKKPQYPFVDQQGKESLNWQITMVIGFLIGFVLTFVIIGIFVILALSILNLVFVIIASIKANQGVAYKYPWSIKFLK